MAIQYWPGLKQDPETQKLSVDRLEETLATAVKTMKMNNYLSAGATPGETLKMLKDDYEDAMYMGYTDIIAFSTGASAFVNVSDDLKAGRCIFLAPGFSPINISQMRKDKKGNIKEYNLTKAFNLYDGYVSYIYGKRAYSKAKNVKDILTLTIQGTEDELVRPKGTIKFYERVQYLTENIALHRLELIEGKHGLLYRAETQEKTLKLIKNFIDKNHS